MEQIISSCHSVIKYNNNYYCAWNDKHKKYAPIGGKTDAGETELMTLAREINEEVTVKGYKSIERLGVHIHEDPHQTPKRIVNVALTNENGSWLTADADWIAFLPTPNSGAVVTGL